MRILFISRSHPPIVGGIEKENSEIFHSLSKLTKVDLMANRLGKWFLPMFLSAAMIRALITLNKYDIVLLGDGVVSVIGCVLKLFYKTPTICIIHGLDLTYNNSVYQRLWVKYFIKRMDKLVAIGNHAIDEGVRRGIPRANFIFVPDGVHVRHPSRQYSKKNLENLIKRPVDGKVLLTLGRLVKRKGVAWFIENVVAGIRQDVIYLIAGSGPDEKNIQSAIMKYKLEDRVILLGSVSEEQKEILYCTADLFIQPNITVEGDMEGFGLVVLEAASYGLTVIASNLEGLKDAIHDGRNGLLLKEHDAKAFTQAITSMLSNDNERTAFGLRAKEYVTKNFSWGHTAAGYMSLFEGILDKRNSN